MNDRGYGLQRAEIKEMLQQLRHGGSDELRARDERAVFRGDSPDAAVSVVATRVAEIDFAVLDDRVVPVGNVDRSVRSHLHVDRAEGDVIRLDQLDLLARSKAGVSVAGSRREPSFRSRRERATVVADDVAADAMASEIVGDQVALPVVGQVPAADDLQTAQLRTARVQAAQDSFRSERGDITRAGHDVVDPLAAGSVGRERHAVIVKRMTPRIDEPASKHL